MSVKVSICTPAYNNVSEVERLLKSVYCQDYRDFEVNISDDSTNDEIERMVQRDFPQVNYRHNQKPYGHIFNWNAAIKMAGGAYIKIMFSDDWFTDSTSLGAFVALLEDNPKAVLAFSGSRQVMLDQNMRCYDRHAQPDFIDRLRQDYRMLFLGNQIGAPSAVIYRRNGALTLFDEKSNWASDMYLYFELLLQSRDFAYTTKPLVSIGVHEHQYTESFAQKDMRIYNDYRYMYEKYGLRASRECRSYFAEQFLVKYHRGFLEARLLGIEPALYWKKYLCEQIQTVKCFVGNRLHRQK